jgi:hypothetical protein
MSFLKKFQNDIVDNYNSDSSKDGNSKIDNNKKEEESSSEKSRRLSFLDKSDEYKLKKVPLFVEINSNKYKKFLMESAEKRLREADEVLEEREREQRGVPLSVLMGDLDGDDSRDDGMS